MTEKLFGNIFDSECPNVIVKPYMFLIITDIRLWFSVLLPITKACIGISLGQPDERLDELLTKKFDVKARLTEISVNDLIGHWQ